MYTGRKILPDPKRKPRDTASDGEPMDAEQELLAELLRLGDSVEARKRERSASRSDSSSS